MGDPDHKLPNAHGAKTFEKLLNNFASEEIPRIGMAASNTIGLRECLRSLQNFAKKLVSPNSF